MKIKIYSEIKNEIWGGANQFLKALHLSFERKGVLAGDEEEPDAVIFNGYQEAFSLVKYFLKPNPKKIVYRLGPILSLHRAGFKWKIMDFLVVWTANLFADRIVFQSFWSYQKARRFGFLSFKKYSIILNAVDENIFYPKNFTEKNTNEKIKIVYSSWSGNAKKGFSYLAFLDKNLDFTKYEFTFIGNSPITFKNIKSESPLNSVDLAEKLRENDIFFSPVKDDACSNALLEGLASGLPAVALDSGGNGELVKEGGVLFNSEKDVLESIEKVAENLPEYQKAIKIKSLDDIAKEYIDLAKF